MHNDRCSLKLRTGTLALPFCFGVLMVVVEVVDVEAAASALTLRLWEAAAAAAPVAAAGAVGLVVVVVVVALVVVVVVGLGVRQFLVFFACLSSTRVRQATMLSWLRMVRASSRACTASVAVHACCVEAVQISKTTMYHGACSKTEHALAQHRSDEGEDLHPPTFQHMHNDRCSLKLRTSGSL
jgi:hypothetical protein